MARILLMSSLVALLFACAGRGSAPGGVIVDMKGVDPARYRVDLDECSQYADQVNVGGQAAAGAAGGAVVGGLIGAVVDDHSVGEGAGVGAIAGGARGTASGLEERQTVVKNCMRGRGYAVLN